MTFRSHSRKEIEQAIHEGQRIWKLDTGTSGNDDILIGGTYQEVEFDVLSFYEKEDLGDWELLDYTEYVLEDQKINNPGVAAKPARTKGEKDGQDEKKGTAI